MIIDSINEEILRIKRELAARFGNDLSRIVADARSREQDTISLPPRQYKSGHSDAPKPPIDGLPDGASTSAAG